MRSKHGKCRWLNVEKNDLDAEDQADATVQQTLNGKNKETAQQKT